MTAKQYLSRIGRLDEKIRQIEEEIRYLQEMAGGLQSPAMDQDRVQTSSGDSRHAAAVNKWIDKENELEKLKLKQADMRIRILKQIHQLDNVKHIQLLYLRYFKYKRLEEIACIMKKSDGSEYSYVHIVRMHGEALSEFSKKFKKYLK